MFDATPALKGMSTLAAKRLDLKISGFVYWDSMQMCLDGYKLQIYVL